MKFSTETKVGFAVLAGLVVLTYMTFSVGAFRGWRKGGYRLYAVFDTAAGLDKNAPVLLSGVEIGRVEEISLADSAAKVTIRINPDVRVRREAEAAIRSSGLLGDRYLQVLPGKETSIHQEGDTLRQAPSAPDLETMMQKFASAAEDVKELVGALREVFAGKEAKEGLKEMLASIRDASREIEALVKVNRENVTRTVSSLRDFSDILKEPGEQLIADLQRIAGRLERGEGTLGKLMREEEIYAKLDRALTDLDSGLKSIDAVAKKFERGEGTLGKLISDEGLYDKLSSTLEGLGGTLGRFSRFRVYVGLRNEYQLTPGENKGFFSIQIQPREDKYYLIEVVDDPRGKVKRSDRTVTVDGATSAITEVTQDRRLEFSAMFGKRISNWSLRAGLIENTFGAGLDLGLLGDTARASFDAWDFASDDPDSPRPHVKATAALYPFQRYLFLQGGSDDFLNRRLRTYFLGAGLRFEDDDLKYLLTGAASLIR